MHLTLQARDDAARALHVFCDTCCEKRQGRLPWPGLLARFGQTRVAWLSLARLSFARLGLARPVKGRLGWARLGWARLG